MAIAHADLVTRLTSDVPATASVPSSTQYDQAVADAVADYSRRCPVRRSATISIVSGTASYALPDDFQTLIELTTAYDGESLLNTAGGLIPVDVDFEEIVTVEGSSLVIYPEPAYTLDRLLWYGAGHVVDSGEYPLMTAADVSILMLRAQALAIGYQANKAAQTAWSYRIGDETVDKKSTAGSMRDQAAALMKQYEDACRRRVGPVTLMG